MLICLASQANELVSLALRDEAHDEVYTFLKRITARNLIKKRLDNTQPLTRREIAEALIEVSEKYQLGQVELTDVEKKHLERYQWLFGNEIEAIKPGFFAPKKKGIVTVKGEDYRIDLDLKARQEAAYVKLDSHESQSKYITTLDLALYAKLGKQIGVFSIFHDRLLSGEADYNPYRTEKSGKFIGNTDAINSMEGYITLSSPRASIQWGIDDNWWGPGRHGALMISTNSAPKDTLKLSALYGPIRFTYLTAVLRENTPEYRPKYMSAHRLEFLPCRQVSIGISEVIVFVNHYELRYLNPFTSFHMQQADDYINNGLLSIDFDTSLLPSIELYGELMVDDLQPAEGKDMLRVWNSKYGVLFGGYWADPLGLRDTDLRVEYAFVNQYAYTHRCEHARYTHQDYVIGHWMGTDADDLWFNAKRWVTSKLRASLTFEIGRQGEGDVKKRHLIDTLGGKSIPEGVNPPKYWEFLSGIVESTRSLSAGLSYISLGRYSTSAEYTYSLIENVGNKSGLDEKKHQLLVKTEYRF